MDFTNKVLLQVCIYSKNCEIPRFGTSLCFQHPLGCLECAAKVEALCFKPLSSELICSRNNNG